ncbi:MAG TPA: alkaline phosphatase, partial [Cystobacter sp.]
MRSGQSKWERRAGRWVCASVTALALSACSGGAGPQGPQGEPGTPGGKGEPGVGKSLSFAPINAASTVAEKRAIQASSKASVNGKEIAIGYETVLRSRQELGGQMFGRMVRKDGQPVKNTDGSDFISPSNDFSSLLQAGNRLFEVTHFETTPAAMYLSELRQSPDGKLSALSTRPIDFSGVDGLWTPCAGSVSPWGTHLGSEEYPPDARATEKAETAG